MEQRKGMLLRDDGGGIRGYCLIVRQ